MYRMHSVTEVAESWSLALTLSNVWCFIGRADACFTYCRNVWDLGSVGRRLDYSKAAAGILFPGPRHYSMLVLATFATKFNEGNHAQ